MSCYILSEVWGFFRVTSLDYFYEFFSSPTTAHDKVKNSQILRNKQKIAFLDGKMNDELSILYWKKKRK